MKTHDIGIKQLINIMDKEIPRSEIKRRRIKRIVVIAAVVAGLCAGIFILVSTMQRGVSEKSLTFAVTDTGNVENSVAASGKVVPAYEEVMVSPVATRILELYCQEGETVEAGQPIMRLDLQSAETEVRRLSDELSMKRYATQRASLDSRTFLTNLEMQIKAKEMSVDELKAEVANERRLDSIGSGTGDRVRQTELAYHTALIELEQLRKQLENERKSHSAAHESNRLEEGIYAKNLEEASRRLEDARVKAPRRATLTYLNNSIGSSVGAGERLAVLSDLGHFRINGEIPEGEAGKLSPGAGVEVKLGNSRLKGIVAHIVPQASNGMVSFTVSLDDDSDSKLRSGVRTDLNVVCGLKEDVTRIPNGQYFHGAGRYVIFVVDESGRNLLPRNVTLGDSNFDYVEVVAGLSPGERVVISDMSDFRESRSIRLE